MAATLWTRIGVAIQLLGAAVMIGAGEWDLFRALPRLDPVAAVAATALNLVIIGVMLVGLALQRLIWDRMARIERAATGSAAPGRVAP
jgi:hypothetical protein